MIESTCLDGANGRSKDDFRGIFRGLLMIEAPIGVDSQCEVRNVLRWQVSTEVQLSIPPSINDINSRDCEDPSLHRESEFTIANDPWVDYHVGIFK